VHWDGARNGILGGEGLGHFRWDLILKSKFKEMIGSGQGGIGTTLARVSYGRKESDQVEGLII